ncbi:MAG: hypothetical protein WKF73_11400 [Nocardioidaceae bacterium]
MLVKSAPSAAFAVQTLPLGESTSDATALRAQSAARYGLPAAELDAALTARWQGTDRPPDGPGRYHPPEAVMTAGLPLALPVASRRQAPGQRECGGWRQGHSRSPRRSAVSGRAARLRARLGERDLAVLGSLATLRLLTGKQLQRLHVTDGSPLTRARRARALLQRLTELRLVVRLDAAHRRYPGRVRRAPVRAVRAGTSRARRRWTAGSAAPVGVGDQALVSGPHAGDQRAVRAAGGDQPRGHGGAARLRRRAGLLALPSPASVGSG